MNESPFYRCMILYISAVTVLLSSRYVISVTVAFSHLMILFYLNIRYIIYDVLPVVRIRNLTSHLESSPKEREGAAFAMEF